MTISLRLSDDDTMLIKKYAEINKMNMTLKCLIKLWLNTKQTLSPIHLMM